MEINEEKHKYANHIFKGKIEIPIDSVAFHVGDTYYICDRHNKGEDPSMVASFIHYSKENRLQFRMAFKGKLHTEPLKKDPSKWAEHVWITLSMQAVDKLTKFLTDANPNNLSSYM